MNLCIDAGELAAFAVAYCLSSTQQRFIHRYDWVLKHRPTYTLPPAFASLHSGPLARCHPLTYFSMTASLSRLFTRHLHPGFSSWHVFIFKASSFSHFHLRSICLPLSHTHCTALSVSAPPFSPHLKLPPLLHHQPPSLNIVPLKHSCVVSSRNTARQKSVISHLSGRDRKHR